MSLGENTIQRCPHDGENPYAQISRDLIRDASISPECRWMLIYLLSMKDGWTISISQIVNHLKGMVGRDKVYDMVNEAIEAGYIKKEIIKKGNLNQGCKYFVSERAKFKKCFRHSEIQEVGAQGAEKADIKNKHILKKENKEKKQQQAPKGAKGVCDAAVAFFKCIEEIDLSEKEKRALMKYPEEEVKKAVLFATHPSTKIKTTLIKTIIWALKEKPEVPETVDEEANRELSEAAEYNLHSEGWILETLSKKTIIYSTLPTCPICHEIKHDEKDFKRKLKDLMRRCGFKSTDPKPSQTCL